ncbi:MAG: SpoIIE family protein phosphatase [Planctomycetota bacterium]|nr:SpoIIE family protein phosphatase [Planctomycetota bacterium]MDA1106561.1 SpoIIE family protein phosphatase [Planctomycetota bacterium]
MHAANPIHIFVEPTFLLFALGMAALWVIAMRWARPEVLGRSVVASSALGLVLILVASAWVVATDRQSQVERMSKQLGELAEVYAGETEHMGHALLLTEGGEPAGSHAALARSTILDAQARWLAASDLVADIYTVRRELAPDGTFVYRLVVDSETDYDDSGSIDDGRELASDPGEILDLPGVEPVFTGETTFVTEPSEDRWGFWVSSHTPLRDSEGTVEAIIGVDYPAELWISSLEGRRRTILLITGLAVAVGMSALSWFAFFRHSAWRRVRTAEQSGERLVDELEMARQSQRGLLAVGSPRLDGFEVGLSTTKGAWDFFDSLTLADGRLLLVVASARGKPIGPMFMTTLAREVTRLGGSIQEFHLRAVSERLAKELQLEPAVEKAVSTTAILVDPEPATCLVFRSSRIPLITDGRELWMPEAGTEPQAGAESEAAGPGAGQPNPSDRRGMLCIPLAPGAVLAILSDGAYEWLRSTGDFEGLQRVRELTKDQGKSASELATAIAGEIARSQGGPPQGAACAVIRRVPDSPTPTR